MWAEVLTMDWVATERFSASWTAPNQIALQITLRKFYKLITLILTTPQAQPKPKSFPLVRVL